MGNHVTKEDLSNLGIGWVFIWILEFLEIDKVPGSLGPMTESYDR